MTESRYCISSLLDMKEILTALALAYQPTPIPATPTLQASI